MEFFLKEGEKMNRLQNGFNRANFPSIWSKVVEVLMRYVMIKGHFHRFHAYLFPMVNHVCYNLKMNFTFWILTSLKKFVKNV